MLDSQTVKKISDFVYQKPRSMQEIAHYLQKNWRTADAYVERIIKEQGILSIRTFREGTRGALKIVFWSNIEKIHSSDFQERLFKRIESSKGKDDFSPFDIYQYVDDDKRYAFLEEQSESVISPKQNLIGSLRSTEQQVLIFSGNLSWVNASQGKTKIMDVFEELAERSIPIKILCRVDIESIKKIRMMLEINHKIKKEMIEIRHAEQPFRTFVIDTKLARFKEIRVTEQPEKKKKKSHDNKQPYIFYEIRDSDWVEWVQKVFWNIFRTSIKAEKRIADIETIENIK
ncbi:MAG: hypothetical protein V1866_00840 [archaeon]